MSQTWNVPGDAHSLSAAVEEATDGDTIVLHGRVESEPVQIRKALCITGDTLVGTGPVVMGIHADAEIRELRIENPNGHGLVCMAGSPQMKALVLHVGMTAFACGREGSPSIKNCRIETCSIGLSVQDDASPIVEDLKLSSTGSGLFFKGRARGEFRRIGIVSGKMAAVEVGQQAAPLLEEVAVAVGGGGGMFFHGQATPRVLNCLIKNVQLAGLEVAGEADPTVDGVSIIDSYGSGLFLHGESSGTYLEIRVEQVRLAGVQISENATPDLENGLLTKAGGSGLWIYNQARAEVIGFEIRDNNLQGLELADTASAVVESCHIHANGGHGVSASDKSSAEFRGTRILSNGGENLVRRATARVEISENSEIEGMETSQT